ncbi:hypothetical protein TNCV_535741 [Trichonephila clavipes]|nr:hypothetical protein TNCV_535741 [Trichonephila clavipes]
MALSTVVDLYIEGKVIPTEFLVLPEAKGNRTLLGLNFLKAAGIVLKVQCPVSYTAWIAFGYPNNRVSERFPVPIDSDKRRSTALEGFLHSHWN